ncbi:ribosomal-processing cysteine protease Prp [Bacillus tianshenii]|nr:ribosomal-processing cysteine protease Prp [Bacillus tianshenii]
MVKVEIKRDVHDKIQSFTLSGHADSGPYGYDLVCAGVSSVSFGAVNAVYELCEVPLEVEQAEDGGYLACTVPAHLDGETSHNVQVLLEGMLVSLRTIERDYGKHIQVIEL